MTKNNRPIISDPNENIPGTTMKERLKKYADEKQEYSRIREEERLNTPSFLDKFIDGIDKIKALFTKKQIDKKIKEDSISKTK